MNRSWICQEQVIWEIGLLRNLMAPTTAKYTSQAMKLIKKSTHLIIDKITTMAKVREMRSNISRRTKVGPSHRHRNHRNRGKTIKYWPRDWRSSGKRLWWRVVGLAILLTSERNRNHHPRRNKVPTSPLPRSKQNRKARSQNMTRERTLTSTPR